MPFQRLTKPALVLAALWLLSACGGGSSGAADTRGAIAISESTGRAAIVWDAPNQGTADERARETCATSDCTVILQFGQCGALSADAARRVYAVAEGPSPEGAQQAADDACRARGGQSCSAPADLHARCN